jgi:hypothetical protein
MSESSYAVGGFLPPFWLPEVVKEFHHEVGFDGI